MKRIFKWKGDGRTARFLDAFYIVWVAGLTSVLCDADHIWMVFGLSTPEWINFSGWESRALHTPLLFVLIGCIAWVCIISFGLRPMDTRPGVELFNEGVAGRVSSMESSFNIDDYYCVGNRFLVHKGT